MKRIRIFIGLSLSALAFSAHAAHAANEAVLASLNDGWAPELNELDSKTEPGKSYLVLISQQPNPPIDLESAEAFRRSLIDVASKPEGEHILGHVIFGWKCAADPKNHPLQGMTAMTGEGDGQILKMAKNGWGFNSMLSTFTDGNLQTPGFLHENVFSSEGQKQKPTFRTMAVEVSQAECTKFYKAMADFVTHPNEPMKKFGASTDPDNFTGGGCISTALSFFSRAGVLPPAEQFKRELKLNKKFLGQGSLVPDATIPSVAGCEDHPTENKPVSFDSFIFSSWATGEADDTLKIHVEDPELLLAFMRSAAGQSLHPGQDPGLMTERTFSSIQPDPYGTDRYGVNRRWSWTHYKKSAATDPDYRRVYDLAKDWLAQRGYSHPVSVNVMGDEAVLLKR